MRNIIYHVVVRNVHFHMQSCLACLGAMSGYITRSKKQRQTSTSPGPSLSKPSSTEENPPMISSSRTQDTAVKQPIDEQSKGSELSEGKNDFVVEVSTSDKGTEPLSAASEANTNPTYEESLAAHMAEKAFLKAEIQRYKKEYQDMKTEYLKSTRKPAKVRDAMAGNPISKVEVKPAWGEDAPKEEEKDEPIFETKYRLQFSNENVTDWTEEEFVRHLEDVPSNVLETILNYPAEDEALLRRLKGDYLPQLLNGTNQARNKAVVDHLLERGVWRVLDDLSEIEYFKLLFLGTPQGGAQRTHLPPQYEGLFKPDRTIEADLRKSSSDVNSQDPSFQTFGATLVEVAPAFSCPVVAHETDEQYNEAVNGESLTKFMQSEYMRKHYPEVLTNSNPVNTVATVAAAHGMRFVAICDINTMTYGQISVVPTSNEPGAPTKHLMHLSKRFRWTCTDPAPLKSRPWSHWEILLRFVLASVGKSFLQRVPDTLKQGLKCPISSEQDALMLSGDQSFGPIYWEDLWDPIRFAVPSTHPLEVEYSAEKLPKDALLLGYYNTGPVYRKMIRGRDLVVKVAVRYDADGSDRPDTDEGFRNVAWDLQDEAKVYKYIYEHIENSHKYVPKLVWEGEIVPGLAHCLVTEYIGRALDDESVELTAAMAQSAIEALGMLHETGILHKKVRLENMLIMDDDPNHVRFIGFTNSRFRKEDEYSDEEWSEVTTKEMEKLKRLFRNVLTSNDHVED